MSLKVLFLDRDGVINKDRINFVLKWEEWAWLPKVKEALARLKAGGWTLVVISNQSCIGRGIVEAEVIEEVNARMAAELAEAGAELDGIYVCPHAPDDCCLCRKPEPGLIHQAVEEMGLDLEGAWLIGDSERDIQAAQAAGVKTILVRTGKGGWVEMEKLAKPDRVFDNLSKAADFLLS